MMSLPTSVLAKRVTLNSPCWCVLPRHLPKLLPVRWGSIVITDCGLKGCIDTMSFSACLGGQKPGWASTRNGSVFSMMCISRPAGGGSAIVGVPLKSVKTSRECGRRRVEGLYRHNVIFGLPWWSETGVGIDKKRQRFFHDVHFPPTVGGFRNSLGTLYERENIEGVRQTRAAAGLKTRYDFQGSGRVEYETQGSLMAVWNKIQIAGVSQRQEGTALELLGQILRRDVNDKYDPREGNLIDVDLGVHYPLRKKYDTLYRAGLRVQQWFPMGKHDVLTVRGEVGRVWRSEEHTS